jgi:uncharacterized protein with PQ loop repeat
MLPPTRGRLKHALSRDAGGAAAAFCTTVSYVPQLRKCWQTGQTGDLSLRMLLLLATGLALWLVYGLMRATSLSSWQTE